MRKHFIDCESGFVGGVASGFAEEFFGFLKFEDFLWISVFDFSFGRLARNASAPQRALFTCP